MAKTVYDICSIVNIEDGLMEESQRRIKAPSEKKIEYGIKYLDDILDSVLPGEFVLITSDSGVGKTQLLYDIAYQNAKKGIKIAVFALEAFRNEPISRMKYKFIANLYYKSDMPKKYGKIFYDRWIRGKYGFLHDFEKEATGDLLETFAYTQFVYKTRTAFTYDIFEKVVDELAESVDLIILDHVHYFEIRNNQYLEEGLMARKLKAIAEDLGKPVIAAGHIRKNREKDMLIHDKEDTIGSSDIYKNATTLIAMCPARIENSSNFNPSIQFPTFFRICKSRYSSSSLKNYVGMHVYDLIESKYKNDYGVFRLNFMATKAEMLELEQYPSQLSRDFEIVEDSNYEEIYEQRKNSMSYIHD